MNLTLRKCGGLSGAFEVMIRCGASVHCMDRQKRTVLYHAATKADSATIVGKIMNNSGQVDARDRDGRSPFHIAAIHGCEEVAERLLFKAKPGIMDLRINDDKTA